MKKLLTVSFALIVLTILSGSGEAQVRLVGTEVKAETAAAQGSSTSLACCECIGKAIYLDLNTGQGAPIDPIWKVNGGSAYTTLPYAGWATNLGPAKWIQPVAGSTAQANVAQGFFKYTMQFTVPKCTIPSDVRLDGTFAADNAANVSLDGNQIASCPSPYCFKSPGQPLSAPNIGPGTHTLTFEVKNEGGPSGLIVNAKLTRQCRREH